MKWVNAISTLPSLESAVREVVRQAKADLRVKPDLGFVFVSSAFASEFSRLLPLLQSELDLPNLVGCSGSGVVGVSQSDDVVEIENRPALSLSLAHLPDVQVQCFHLECDALPDLDSPPEQWVELIGVSPSVNPHFVLMLDPFSSEINDFLQGLDYAYPGSVKVGGLAGIDSFNRSSGLFCGDRFHQSGIVGVALSGNVVLDTIVAQGCRPIGPLYRVAEGEKNVMLKLEVQDNFGNSERLGVPRPPLEILQEIFQDLNEADRALAQHSLFVGVAQNSFKQQLEAGDFLIRNLLGVDPRVGAIAIGDRIRPGQRIQFHLRDARTSAEDLETLLSNYHKTRLSTATASPVGALLFACAGRGEGLYNKPNFDSRLFSRYLPYVPLSGFFCGGEIGPVGSTTFLHGYTSVFGICRPVQLNYLNNSPP